MKEEKGIKIDITKIFQKEIQKSLDKGKLNLACLLNELEDSVKSEDYLKAINDIKCRTGIKGTILELFRY